MIHKRVLLAFVLGLTLLGPGGGLVASADEATPEPGGGGVWRDASIAFRVGVCPPEVGDFSLVQFDEGISGCTGTGLAGDEAPLAGGTVSLTAVETGDTYSIALDGDGRGSVAIDGGLTYVASFSIDGGAVESRSICGSPMSGIAGPSESGVLVSSGEAMQCVVLTLSPDATPPQATIILHVRGCPGVTDASALLIGDGVLDCNGDPSADESVVFGSGTATFQNVTTGDSMDVAIDATGFAESGPVGDGGYVVAVSRDGTTLPFASVCGGTAADGSPLGLLGGIGDASAPLPVSGAVAIECSLLVAQGTSPTPAPSRGASPAPAGGPVSVTVRVRACPADFEIGTALSDGTIHDLASLDQQFVTSCVAVTSFSGPIPGPLAPAPDGYRLEASPGAFVGVHVAAGNDVVWTSCESMSGGQRPLLFSPTPDGTLLILQVPASVPASSLVCTVYLAAAG